MITFFSEDIKFNLNQKNRHKAWLRSVASEYNFKIGDLNYIFCSDDYLLNINKEYLGHDYFTDIITFDNRDQFFEADKICGDIFISIDTVSANGTDYGEGFDRELHRVMSHGLLHLIGFDDHNDEDIVKMRLAEERAIEIYG